MTGILYIHPETDNLSSPALRRNLQLLRALIGEHYLERVTIIVKPLSQRWQQEPATIYGSILEPGSPFHSFYQGVSEPKVMMMFESTQQSIDNIIRLYASFGPRRFYVQDKLVDKSWKMEDVASYLQNLPDDEHMVDHMEIPMQATIPMPQGTGQSINRGWPSGVMHVQPGDKVRESEAQLDSKRKGQKQTDIDYQHDHEPCHSHLQAPKVEEPEPGRITQSFDDINYLIEDLGQVLSDHLVDYCPQKIIPIQDLVASQLQKLSEIFGHTPGRPSLVKSSGGEYPDLADFLFYAIQAILCDQLYQCIFKPFHPSIAGSEHERENSFIVGVYKQMTRQGKQKLILSLVDILNSSRRASG